VTPQQGRERFAAARVARLATIDPSGESAQIPDKALARIAATLTVDLKVVRAELREKEKERTLYSELELVERYLDEEGVVGTVDEPRQYFRGELRMRCVASTN
jgi:hypothetical protein